MRIRLWKRSWGWILLGGSVLGSSFAAGASAPEFTAEGLVPLEILFRDPEAAEVILSPDGRYLVGQKLEEVGGGGHWLATFSMDLESRELTILSSGRRDIIARYGFAGPGHLWVEYPFGALFRTAPQGGEMTKLRSGIGQRDVLNRELDGARVLDERWEDPAHLLMYDVDTASSVWRLNVVTAEVEPVIAGERRTIRWWLDAQGELALAESVPGPELRGLSELQKYVWWHTAERVLYRIRENAFAEPLPIELGPLGADALEQFAQPVFSRDGETLYYLSQNDTDTVALMAMDLATGEAEVFRADERGDLVELLTDRNRRELIGYRTASARQPTVYLKESFAALQAKLEDAFPGEQPRIEHWDRSYRRFLIRLVSDRHWGKYYLFDRTEGTLEPVFDRSPWLAPYALSPMTPIRYPARDGLIIEGYLTRPTGAAAKAPYPTVLYVHGGPWMRDHWNYDPMVQFFADRGYAVLQVNFRGSTGYGKAFLGKGDKEWGRAMQDDLTDAVAWAVAEGHTDPARVAIAGASYGGYATMAGLAFTPDLYQAGIAMMGLYDLTDRLEEMEHYEGAWSRFAQAFVRERVGDPEHDGDLLRAASPVFFAEQIEAPVLLIHGGDDRRARVDQSYEMVRRLRRAGKDVERLYLDGVGHTLGDEQTRQKIARRIESFLREHMPSDLLKAGG